MYDFAAYLRNTDPFIMQDRQINSLEQLSAALEGITKTAFRRHVNDSKNDFYNWIRHSVGDNRLARDIMRIQDKRNMAGIIAARVAQLKDYARHPGRSSIQRRTDMYADHIVFSIDKEVCSGCEICSLVCPKEAITVDDGISVSDDCTRCGFCVPFCPQGCMSLRTNGEESSFYEEKNMIPRLPEPEVTNDASARRLFTGSYQVRKDCPPGCEECVRACPVNIISRYRGGRELRRITVDTDLCLLCGACKNACPHGIIVSSRNSLRFEGDGYCHAFNEALGRLCHPGLRSIYHNNKNLLKIRQLAARTSGKDA